MEARSPMNLSGDYILLIDHQPSHARALEEALLANNGAPAKLVTSETLAGGLDALTHSKP